MLAAVLCLVRQGHLLCVILYALVGLSQTAMNAMFSVGDQCPIGDQMGLLSRLMPLAQPFRWHVHSVEL